MQRLFWIGLASSALLLAGCQSGRTVQSVAPAEPSPKAGGILTVSGIDDPSDWDPTSGAGGAAARGLEYAYNRLLGYDISPGTAFTDARLIPEIAERWEVSPDAQTFTF